MVDSSIVTLTDKNDVAIGDFEIPIKITVKELQNKLVAMLKAMDCEKYEGLEVLEIEYQGDILSEDDTLYQNAVWDGSIVKLVY